VKKMIRGKWITKARNGQKKYRVYRKYTDSGRNVLVYQSNSLVKARDKLNEIFQQGVYRGRGGRGVAKSIFLVNEKGEILSN
jgi:hypothetical protein